MPRVYLAQRNYRIGGTVYTPGQEVDVSGLSATAVERAVALGFLDEVAVTAVDVLASRPAAGNAGDLYFATDTSVLYVDDGTEWTAVGGGAQSYLVLEQDNNPNLLWRVYADSNGTLYTKRPPDSLETTLLNYSPELLWKLDDSTGPAQDSTANNNDSTGTTGTPTYGAADPASVLGYTVLNSESGAPTRSVPASLQNLTAATYVGMFYRDGQTSGAAYYPFVHGSNVDSDIQLQYLKSTGKYRLFLDGSIALDTTYDLPLNQWAMLIFRWDGSNWVLKDAHAGDSTPQNIGSGAKSTWTFVNNGISFGGRSGTSGDQFNGYISHGAVFASDIGADAEQLIWEAAKEEFGIA